MDANAFLWIDVFAAAALAVWFVARRPDLGPRSLRSALVVFAAGQLFPTFGLALLRPAVGLPQGLVVALVGVALPSFVVMFVTTIWLFKACTSPIDGARRNHRVRDLSRSRV